MPNNTQQVIPACIQSSGSTINELYCFEQFALLALCLEIQHCMEKKLIGHPSKAVMSQGNQIKTKKIS